MEKIEQLIPIRETVDLSIYLNTVGGEKIFVKKPKTENGVEMNTREFYNQKFLRTATEGQDVGFEFLTPIFDKKVLVYPDISEAVDWLATDNTPQTPMANLDEYIAEMVQFIRFCLAIPYESIPSEIKLDAQKRVANVWSNFETDSTLLLEAAILSETDKIRMKNCLGDGINKQAFQHHDMVPWHMARKHSDGKIILVDSGWSGWSFKYYDIAYFVLQMIGYAERPRDALRFLEIIKKEFQSDPQFQKTLSTSLSYRGIRLATERYKQGMVKNAQDVLSFTLSELQ